MKLRELFGDDAPIDPATDKVEVTGLAVDSRLVQPGSLFFALAGVKTVKHPIIAALTVLRSPSVTAPSVTHPVSAGKTDFSIDHKNTPMTSMIII